MQDAPIVVAPPRNDISIDEQLGSANNSGTVPIFVRRKWDCPLPWCGSYSFADPYSWNLDNLGKRGTGVLPMQCVQYTRRRGGLRSRTKHSTGMGVGLEPTDLPVAAQAIRRTVGFPEQPPPSSPPRTSASRHSKRREACGGGKRQREIRTTRWRRRRVRSYFFAGSTCRSQAAGIGCRSSPGPEIRSSGATPDQM